MSLKEFIIFVVSGANKNAVAKLNILFRDRVRYCDLAETPVRHTNFTAFTVAVSVDGRHYVGVGKTKKAARNAAAERALMCMQLWTDEDEMAKYTATMEVDEDPVVAVYRMKDLTARERSMQSMEQAAWGGKNHQQPPSRWNPEVRGGRARGRGSWRDVGHGWDDDPSWGGDSGWGVDRGWGRDPNWGYDSTDWGRDPGWDNHGWDDAFQPGRGDWNNRGPQNRGRNNRGSFPGRPGRSGAVRGSGFRGAGTGESFHKNTYASSTGSRGKVRSDRGGRGFGGGLSSGKAGQEKPGLAPTQSGTSTLSRNTTARMTVPQSSGGLPSKMLPPKTSQSQFSAPHTSLTSGTASTFPQWSSATGMDAGVYQTVTNPIQAGFPSAAQAPQNYISAAADFGLGVMPYQTAIPDMTFAGNSGELSAALASYGTYAQAAYGSAYGQGGYGSY